MSNETAVALAPSRLPMNGVLAKEYELTPAKWRVLVEQTFPAAKSVEAVLMALEYCRARNLDVFKKPVHIVPMWSSAKKAYVETVWPGISEIRTTAARTGSYAGIDEIIFGPDVERTFVGRTKDYDTGKYVDRKVALTFPAWAKATVYRIVKNHRSPFTATVHWAEAYATAGKGELPNEMWCKRPRGQLAKCVEAAAIRMAFPEEVGNDLTAEEMSGQVIDHEPSVAMTPPPAPKQDDAKVIEYKPAPEQMAAVKIMEEAKATIREVSGLDQLPPPEDGPPPAPSAKPLPIAEAEPEETAGDILARAEDWLGQAKDAEALESVWEAHFHPLISKLVEADRDTLRGLYFKQLEKLEPNPLRGG